MNVCELTRSSGKPALDQKARNILLESFEEAAKVAYCEAIESGAREPVLFILDCEDEAGHALGLYLFGEEAVRETVRIIREARNASGAEYTTAVLVKAASYARVKARAFEAFPHLKDAVLRTPTEGVFVCVVATLGGFSAHTIEA